MTTRVWGDAYRTTQICVDAYHSGALSGRMYNQASAEGIRFQSLTELLKEMERTLDNMEFPKAFTAPRRFSQLPRAPAAATFETEQKGSQATFAVRILFRQNASWQGTVTWLEGKQEQSFRSALELIFLLSSALEHKEAS